MLCLYAQNLVTFNFNEKDIESKENSLSNGWNLSLEGSNLHLSQGKISNSTNQKTNELYLSYCISEEPVELSKGKFTGILMNKIPIKPIAKNSSIVGVNIQSNLNFMPKDGNYYQTLILSDAKGHVKDILQLANIIIENNVISLNVPTEIEKEISIEAVNTGYSVAETIKLDIAENSAISLNEDWQVEVLFQEWLVKVIGGNIENSSNSPAGKLYLDIYLINNNLENEIEIINPSGSFEGYEGYHLVTIPVLETLAANSRVVGINISKNLNVIVPQGEYYISLTLSEEKNNKKTVVAIRIFDNLVTL